MPGTYMYMIQGSNVLSTTLYSESVKNHSTLYDCTSICLCVFDNL